MATTQVPYTDLVPNGSTLQPAGTTLVAAPTNDMEIVRARPELTVLRVENTHESNALTFTVVAGENPPALAAGQGNLAVSVAAETVRYFGPFESGRFLQNDGTLRFTSSTTSGTVTALKVPRNT
ncbi:hypothetical protein AB0B28_08165 [Glycomyces sp. NPDC046736]|uniref:hypothetical protein n=1 Tax=Glycomyces sp. NPDC046736 TaxID=3155615 RepID=UPI0033C5EC5D